MSNFKTEVVAGKSLLKCLDERTILLSCLSESMPALSVGMVREEKEHLVTPTIYKTKVGVTSPKSHFDCIREPIRSVFLIVETWHTTSTPHGECVIFF